MPGYLKTHSKWKEKLADVSLEAYALWHGIGMYCQANPCSGRFPKAKVVNAVDRRLSLKKAEAAALELAADGLILSEVNSSGVSCWVRCDWDEDQLDDEVWTNPILHDRMLRRKQLQRDKYLVDKIKHRDRNLCRYCGIRVNWLDRNGPTGGTYDHIDPDGVNSIANVVVACRRCNGIKKDRTPDQAEMSLFDPGTDASAVAAHVARTSANATPAPAGASRKPGSGLAAPREHARDVPELGPNQAASGRSRSDQVALDRDELQPHPPNARPQAGTADSIEESQRPCTTRLRVRSPNEPGTCSSKT